MLHTEEISYEADGITFQGLIAYEQGTHPKPGILIAHDWSGRNDFVRKKAEQLASMGYVGFAVDMYGNGKTGKTTRLSRAVVSSIHTFVFKDTCMDKSSDMVHK